MHTLSQAALAILSPLLVCRPRLRHYGTLGRLRAGTPVGFVITAVYLSHPSRLSFQHVPVAQV